MINNSIGYAEVVGVLGEVVEFSLLQGTYTLLDENQETHVVDMDEVKELKYLGDFEEIAVYEGDVFGNASTKKMYELTLNEQGLINIYALDAKLKRISNKPDNTITKLSTLSRELVLIGSIYELEPNSTPEFNIRVVRKFVLGETSYFYACNDKENEMIDMIKVVFVGSHLLEEEDYQRITISYDEYQEQIDNGVYKEVSPQELQNYALGLSRNTVATDVIKVEADKTTYESVGDYSVEDEEDDMDGNEFDDCDCSACKINREEDIEAEEEDEDDDDDCCEECGEEEQDCDCELF